MRGPWSNREMGMRFWLEKADAEMLVLYEPHQGEKDYGPPSWK
jgi:hypothetical protein